MWFVWNSPTTIYLEKQNLSEIEMPYLLSFKEKQKRKSEIETLKNIWERDEECEEDEGAKR